MLRVVSLASSMSCSVSLFRPPKRNTSRATRCMRRGSSVLLSASSLVARQVSHGILSCLCVFFSFFPSSLLLLVAPLFSNYSFSFVPGFQKCSFVSCCLLSSFLRSLGPLLVPLVPVSLPCASLLFILFSTSFSPCPHFPFFSVVHRH